jgi:hypothetical protein
MIDTTIVDDVMQNFPEFSYEVKPIANSENVELLIEKDNKYKSGIGFRRIRKVLTRNDDVGLLENVLKSKEG